VLTGWRLPGRRGWAKGAARRGHGQKAGALELLISHPVWKDRYGGHDRRPFRCQLQREERIALEAPARFAGCKLVVNPHLSYTRWGESARRVRLEC